jgi:ABC-type phosphate/phosphonate transport system substrate-binding protein
MGETIKVNHSMTPQHEQKIEEALNRRNEVDYQCFIKLQQLLPFVDARDSEVQEVVKTAEKLIRSREKANHHYLAALTGRS